MKITKRAKIGDKRIRIHRPLAGVEEKYTIGDSIYEPETGDTIEITEVFKDNGTPKLGWMKDDPYDGYWEVVSIRLVEEE